MDNINHPKHYTREGRKECIDEMIDTWGEGATAIFCLLNAHKYLYRAGLKDKLSDDLKKAQWYINKYNQLTKEIK